MSGVRAISALFRNTIALNVKNCQKTINECVLYITLIVNWAANATEFGITALRCKIRKKYFFLLIYVFFDALSESEILFWSLNLVSEM